MSGSFTIVHVVRPLGFVLVLAGTAAAQTDWFPSSASGPAPRTWHAAARDAVRDEVLLFGGEVQGQASAETWVWDGSAWSARAPATVPAARTRHALAPAEGVGAIMVGGITRDGPSNETWVWTGTDWILRSTVPTFQPRHDHALAEGRLMSGLRSVICFGGLIAGQPTAETQESSGIGGGWTLRSSGPLPGARYRHAMTYDAVRSTMVMFGGLAAGGQLAVNDTWEWTGYGWLLRVPITRPPARHGHAMAQDPVSGRIVMFGGETAGGPTDDVWEWDGMDWRQRATVTRPSARLGHAMAIDPTRGRVFLFGGSDASGTRGDTLTYGRIHLANGVAFGHGCRSAALGAVPGALPWIGDGYRVRIEGAVGFQAVFLLFGASNAAFGPLPLPFDLTAAGMPGCSLYCSGDAIDVLFTIQPPPLTPFYLVPSSPSLIGQTFYQQALCIDPGANPFGMTTSNGLELRIGSH